MRKIVLLFGLAMLPTNLLGHGRDGTRWPDPQIEIPPRVESFIQGECIEFDRRQDASRESCIHGEEYGYRAVVMMLSDPQIGEAAAERYRGCRQGLGSEGGRFHRRRAECVGTALGYVWRFEFSRRASLDGPSSPIDFAQVPPDSAGREF